jgi:hypothetical protein
MLAKRFKVHVPAPFYDRGSFDRRRRRHNFVGVATAASLRALLAAFRVAAASSFAILRSSATWRFSSACSNSCL